MDWNDGTLIAFSPTGTTRAVLGAVVQGWGLTQTAIMDMTRPMTETNTVRIPATQVTFIGVPVYAGRVAPAARERLRRLRGSGGPAVLVVVYGNREYEDALLELHDLALEQGFKPVSAAAFIGEHSFSNAASPIAVGRPDEDDLTKAEAFGAASRKDVQAFINVDAIPPLHVPGNSPYRDVPERPAASPSTNDDQCVRCGDCVAVCPTNAIILQDGIETDAGKCILCCACVKNCPTGARQMLLQRVLEIAQRLSENCSARKEPEFYLCTAS